MEIDESVRTSAELTLRIAVLLPKVADDSNKLEEPELDVPPSLQRKLVAQAVAIAQQTICTSDAPRVAAFYPATSVLVIERAGAELSATPMLATSLVPTATSTR
jgi:predicted ATPase